MAFLAPAFAAMTASTGAILATASTVLSTVGAVSAAAGAKATGKYQNQLAEKRAGEERAVASKASQAERRKGELLMSRARAVGAASGGGIDVNQMGKMAEETELRSLNAIWEGEGRATEIEQQGAEALFEGESRARAGYLRAGTTLLGGSAGIMKDYG